MSENKFLKNLSQPAPPPAEAPAGSDPIQRLTAELSRQSETIEALTDVIKRLQSQPPKLDAKEVAQQLRPALVAVLPTAQSIQEAGAAAAQQVAQAAQRIPRRIAVQGEVLGFSSMRSMGLILTCFSLLMITMGYFYKDKRIEADSWQQQALQARQELEAHQRFVDWLSRQKPYQNALKQYSRQINPEKKVEKPENGQVLAH